MRLSSLVSSCSGEATEALDAGVGKVHVTNIN